MDIGILEQDKEDLLKLQEKYHEKLITIIKNNASQIKEYEKKLKELEEKNLEFKINSVIMQDKLYKQEKEIERLLSEVIKLEDELYAKTITNSCEKELIKDLQEAYMSNDIEDVEIIMDSILDNIEKIEKHLDKEDITILMIIFYIYDDLTSLLNSSLEAKKYYESDNIEASLLKLLDNENKCKLYDIVENCSQEIIKNSNELFMDLEDTLRKKISESIIDISYKSFSIVEDKDSVEKDDKTIMIKAWVKLKDKNVWILVNGLYSIKQNKLYIDKGIMDKFDINRKDNITSSTVNNQEIGNACKELKKLFLSEGVGSFKECNTSKKKYAGENRIINTILKSDINEEKMSLKDAKTLLLMSFFYNFHSELIRSSKYMESIFKSNSSEGVFIRILDLEKYMQVGKTVTMPVSVFIKNNVDKIKNIDLQVKKKALKIIKVYWGKEIPKLFIVKSLQERCSYDNEILTTENGYLKYINQDKKSLYILVQYSHCRKCNFSYFPKSRINKLAKKFTLYKLDESKFTVLGGRENELNLEIRRIIENDMGNKLYTKLLTEFNYNNKKKSVEIFEKIISDNNIIKSFSRIKCITLLYIGYLLQNNAYGLDKIKAVGNVGTSVEVVLYSKMINKKDVNDYLRLYQDSLNLIDPLVKEKIIKEVVKLSKTNIYSENNSSKKDEYLEYNLSAESVIKKLGYSTSIGREARWKILNNKVIPEIGKYEVIKHIKFLIRMNKNRSSMANAVNEWMYDLNKLLKL